MIQDLILVGIACPIIQESAIDGSKRQGVLEWQELTDEINDFKWDSIHLFICILAGKRTVVDSAIDFNNFSIRKMPSEAQ